jgi:hypothetical protein
VVAGAGQTSGNQHRPTSLRSNPVALDS